MPERSRQRHGVGGVAYLLKAYPRTSELFILSEIFRLEQAGVPLQLYAIKPAEPTDRTPRHPVVDRIKAHCRYLRPTAGLSSLPFPKWFVRRVPAFAGPLVRTALRTPVGLLRATVAATAEAWRAHRAGVHGETAEYFRQLLLASDLADRLARSPAIRHLHAHYAHAPATVAWLCGLITGLPFSFTGHARDIYCEALNPAGLLSRKLRAARFAVTCTEANRRWLHSLAPTASVHRIYHGMNAEFSELLGATGVHRNPDAGFRLLAVGRMVAKKGLDVLVEAVARLVADGVPAELVVVGGEGDHTAVVRRLVRVHHLESRVTLSGVLDQRRLYDAYRRADVFCLPCRVLDDGDRDGIPNVLVEAMAAGLPVVTTPVSGIPELVVDGHNGLLVPPENPVALAEALRGLWDDRALADRLATTGRREVIARFDGDRLAARLADLFSGVAA